MLRHSSGEAILGAVHAAAAYWQTVHGHPLQKGDY